MTDRDLFTGGSFTTGSAVCSRTALRERKARVLARFTLAEAQALCDLNVQDTDRFDPCPACGHSGLAFVTAHPSRGRLALTDDPAKARQAICQRCDFAGDAVQFVMAARHFTHTTAALDWIEAALVSRQTAPTEKGGMGE